MLVEMRGKVDSRASKKYEELEIGSEFPSVRCELTPSLISRFEEAVEASSHGGLVPPLAILACVLKAASQSIDMPPGSVHASQEIEFLKAVSVGSTIDCHVRIIKKISRSGLRMVVIGLKALDRSRELVLSAATTVVSPAEVGISTK